MISQAPPPPGKEHDKDVPRGPHPIEPLMENLAEIREFAAHYLATRWDSIAFSARRAAIWAVFGLVGMLAGGTAVAASVVLVLVGASRAVGLAIGPVWAGQLIIGFGFLAFTAIAMLTAAAVLRRHFRDRKVDKYESQRHAQRIRVGRDVAGRVAGQ